MIAKKQALAGLTLEACSLDSPSDLERVRLLFDDNGLPRDRREIAWKYQPFAGDSAQAVVGLAGHRFAGLYVAVPARFLVDGLEVRAAQSLDTMVDQSFRGQGLFTKLARRAYAGMSKQGIAFVYGFPNENSFGGFRQALGWSFLDPVPFLFRPLRFGFALRALYSRLGWPSKNHLNLAIPLFGAEGSSQRTACLPHSEALNELWKDFSRSFRVARVRDHAYLTRRYAERPDSGYLYRTVWRGKELSGLVVYRVVEKHGGRLGYIMELMTRLGDGRTGRSLLQGALFDMVQQGCDGCLAWCFSHTPSFRHYLGRGFFPLPEALRPIELHLGFRSLDVRSSGLDQAVILSKRKNWYLSYSDSDTV